MRETGEFNGVNNFPHCPTQSAHPLREHAWAGRWEPAPLGWSVSIGCSQHTYLASRSVSLQSEYVLFLHHIIPKHKLAPLSDTQLTKEQTILMLKDGLTYWIC